MRQLEMADQARMDVHAKEKAQAAEEQRIGQEADARAWLRELRRTGEASSPAGRADVNGA